MSEIHTEEAEAVELSPPVRSTRTDYAYGQWESARHNRRRVEMLFFRYHRGSWDDVARARADADHAWRKWDAACREARREAGQ